MYYSGYWLLVKYISFRLRLQLGFDSSGPTLVVDTESAESKRYLQNIKINGAHNCFIPMTAAEVDDTGILSSKWFLVLFIIVAIESFIKF